MIPKEELKEALDYISERTHLTEGYLSVKEDCKIPYEWMKEVNKKIREVLELKERKK